MADVTKLFEHGSNAFERGSWELAIMVWQQLLAMEPDHVNARRMLREAENRMWAQSGAGTSAKIKTFIKGIPVLIAYGIHFSTKDYDRCLVDCEKILAEDPNHSLALHLLNTAALKGGHNGVALITMEYLIDKNPNDIKVLKKLGYLYEKEEKINEALTVWEKVNQLVPADYEASGKRRDLAALRTMKDGKYDTAGKEHKNYRDSLKNEQDAVEREQAGKIIRTDDDLTRAIARVTQDYQSNPGQKRYVIQLADLYRRAQKFQQAVKLYEEAIKIDPMDFGIPEKMGDMKIEEFNAREKALADKIKDNPDNAATKGELVQVQKLKFEFQLQEYARQIQVRPTDAGLHKKLGDLYFEHKMYDEGAVEFQKASADPRFRIRCKKMMGLCLFNTGKYQLAAGQFEQASDGNAANLEMREIMYYFAITLEKLGEKDRAETEYKKIFDVDMAYKDVQKRLDRLMHERQERSSATQSGEAS